MNKTISKALLCGLVASTFILVNCQNDPAKREVKADVGTPAGTDPTAKTAVVKLPLCSPELLSAYDVFKKLIASSASLLNTKKEDVNSTISDNLIRLQSDMIDAGNAALKEMSNLKPEPVSAPATAAAVKATSDVVTGCYKSDDKQNPITVEKLKSEMDRADKRITSLTGNVSERAKAADVEKKAKLGILVYSVSSDLKDILSLPTAATNNYLVDGKFADSATLLSDKDNKLKAVCRVTTGGIKLSDSTSPLSLQLVSKSKTKMSSEKDMYELNFSAGDSLCQISCYFPANISFEDGLAQAAGPNLTLIKDVTKDPKKDVTPAPTAPVKLAPATSGTSATPAAGSDADLQALDTDLLTS